MCVCVGVWVGGVGSIEKPALRERMWGWESMLFIVGDEVV